MRHNTFFKDRRLRRAAKEGDTIQIKRQIMGGADINSASFWWGLTVLHLAARNGQEGAVLCLLAKAPNLKVDVRSKPCSGSKTPLEEAAERGWTNICQTLVFAGANANAVFSHRTPLVRAVENEHIDTAKILIALGANVDAKSVPLSPLHIAILKGSAEMVALLLRNNANIYRFARCPLGKTRRTYLHGNSLCLAVGMDNFEVVKTLVNLGAKVDANLVIETSPRHYITQSLLTYAVKIAMVNTRKDFPVNVTTISFLIKNGADIFFQPEATCPPTHEKRAGDIFKTSRSAYSVANETLRQDLLNETLEFCKEKTISLKLELKRLGLIARINRADPVLLFGKRKRTRKLTVYEIKFQDDVKEIEWVLSSHTVI